MNYADVVLGDSPVGYWRLNEPSGTPSGGTMADELGVSDGAYAGVVSLGNTAIPPLEDDLANTYAIWNKSDFEYGSVPHSATINPTGDISVEVWTDSDVQSPTQRIVSKYDDTVDAGWMLRQNNNGVYEFAGRDGGGAVRSSGNTGDFRGTNWRYVVGIRRGSVWEVWVNAALEASNDIGSAGSIGTTRDLHIARASEPGVTDYYNGPMDEVALYDYALSEAQILAHFCAAQPSDGKCRSRGWIIGVGY